MSFLFSLYNYSLHFFVCVSFSFVVTIPTSFSIDIPNHGLKSFLRKTCKLSSCSWLKSKWVVYRFCFMCVCVWFSIWRSANKASEKHCCLSMKPTECASVEQYLVFASLSWPFKCVDILLKSSLSLLSSTSSSSSPSPWSLSSSFCKIRKAYGIRFSMSMFDSKTSIPSFPDECYRRCCMPRWM